jgi:hypothetical protein
MIGYCIKGEESYLNIMLDGCTYPKLTADAIQSFQKAFNVNKTCQLKPGKGADIW